MAFKKSLQTPFGIEVQNAYHRVEGVRLISKTQIKFQLRASVDGVLPHFADSAYECEYDLNGENPIKQAYRHLKTMPEFSDITDC
jgi:hypothetical protein